MKKILIAIIMMATVTSFAQTSLDISQIPLNEGKITYTLIDTLKGVSKAVLFNNLNEWIAKNANNSNHIVKLSDRESGRIIAKVGFTTPVKVNGFTFQYVCELNTEITVKDDRYRVLLSDYIVKIDKMEVTGEQVLSNTADLEKAEKNKQTETILSINRQTIDALDQYSKQLLSSIKSDIRKSSSKKDEF